MRIINTSVAEFPQTYRKKKVVCFGAGDTGKAICEGFIEHGILDAIDYFVDNDASKWDKDIAVGGKKFMINPPEHLKKENFSDKIIFITSRFWDQMIEQLEEYSLADSVRCYVYILFKLCTYPLDKAVMSNTETPVIPKKLHYCWFGGGELPLFAVNCIESWRKYCPDYEIIEWNEKNYDVYKNRFTKEVYDYGHYSALSSYARLDIIQQYGGIYFDTDVEVVKNLDELLYQDAFMGFEVSNYVNTGHGFGGKAGNSLLAEAVDIYDHMTFFNADGEFHYKNHPTILTEILARHGLRLNGMAQRIEDINIYPSYYFDPALQIPTEDSFSIHKYSSLWSLKDKNMEKMWKKQREYYYQLLEESKIEEVR